MNERGHDFHEESTIVTKAQVEEIAKTYPTPFYIYDEKGIRETARKINQAFSWNKGYKEYFAVKATPNPYILKILQEEGCGTDCSSYTELLMSKVCGFSGRDIMFSSMIHRTRIIAWPLNWEPSSTLMTLP